VTAIRRETWEECIERHAILVEEGRRRHDEAVARRERIVVKQPEPGLWNCMPNVYPGAIPDDLPRETSAA
jgi:hypothetical protein